MLVLLPPSEGKAPPPRRGRPLDLERLSFPELNATRSSVVDGLLQLCARPEETARTVLGLSPGLAGEVALDRALLTTPTRPASELYTGVLYEALGLATLDAAARRRAVRSIVVVSGLWGALRLTDRVPAYRLAGDVALPGLGPLPSVWRDPLDAVLPAAAGRGVVLDLRSSTYAALWRPTAAVAERTVVVRVLHERVPGDPATRTVVSHFNKATKGRLLRTLITEGADPRTPAALVRVLRELGHTVIEAPAKPGRPVLVDLVVDQV